MFPWKAPKASAFAPLCLILTLAPTLAGAARPAGETRPAEAPAPAAARPADSCAVQPAPAPKDTCRPMKIAAPAVRAAPRKLDAGDPFLAAALGVLPLASGFYVSETPVKGAAFTLADLMLIGAIVQVRSDANHNPRDAVTYYWLMAGINVADALLSVLQVQSDAAKRLSVNINPSDRPGVLLGWRF
jgi:hypothetical protein